MTWGRWAGLALAAVFAASFALHAHAEEALLETHFGEAFAAYRRRVPRLLPWPRPRRG
jgi:protein-S-isoprenylcysteine O-methyltransferase Ste14